MQLYNGVTLQRRMPALRIRDAVQPPRVRSDAAEAKWHYQER